MMASEMITQLEALIKKKGDLPIHLEFETDSYPVTEIQVVTHGNTHLYGYSKYAELH